SPDPTGAKRPVVAEPNLRDRRCARRTRTLLRKLRTLPLDDVLATPQRPLNSQLRSYKSCRHSHDGREAVDEPEAASGEVFGAVRAAPPPPPRGGGGAPPNQALPPPPPPPPPPPSAGSPPPASTAGRSRSPARRPRSPRRSARAASGAARRDRA